MKRNKFKFPSFSQWKQIFKVLKKAEKITLLVLAILAAGSLFFLATDFYIKNTKEVPAFGGTYAEGIVGQPRFINPIYGETNDVDRTLINLIYSGLMTYDKNGKIVNDLASSYNISDDGKTYDFQLKDNIFWQDGKPLTADDIIFTIKIIQNSDYKSPLRANWIGVDVEKTSDKSLSLVLKTPYNSFLENCALKIIPQHIWENVLAENFALSSYNLQPIGSGPYSFAGLEQSDTGFIKSIYLESNHKYYGKLPYISNVSFQFFANKDDLVKAANSKSIGGFSLTALDNSEAAAEKEIKQGWVKNEKFSTYSLSLPRYFAVFFNTNKTKILSDINIRKALNYSVDKQGLINQISSSTKSNMSLVDSPILPDFFGLQAPTSAYTFDIERAKKLLDKSGFKDNGSNQRVKPNNKKPAFQFKNYLAARNKSTDVTQLQGCLARLDDNFKNLLQNETSGIYGKGTENAVTEFQKKYLPDTTPTGEVGKATRTKLNELCITPQDNSQLLKFTITTINQPQLVQIANLLKDSWQKAGITVDIKAVEISELKPIIKTRDYDALLYGEVLGSEPDLYPFWHSSQINDPGLNLSAYQSKDADQLLKEARETLDITTKQDDYEKLQNVIIADAPALFLYNPDYIYWVSQKINGVNTTKIVDPAKRFSNISEWYIKTKRVFK
ncbi:MAG: ABC transporter substrate-binding protein [Patescibacteria group bacterium]